VFAIILRGKLEIRQNSQSKNFFCFSLFFGGPFFKMIFKKELRNQIPKADEETC